MIISSPFELPKGTLVLPENFVIPEKRIKRSPRPVDFNDLTEEQHRAAMEIMAYIEDETDYRMWCLKGYAGTGKTYTLGKLQDWLLYAKKYKVAASAPTNKAVQVIKDLCEIADSKLTFSTIHSLLGLKESYDYQGRLKFIPDPQNPPSLEGFDVLFIDEASMFDDDLFRLINPFVEQKVKIIFIGDPAQIPPINKMDCIPFITKWQKHYKIGVSELREIRRQAHDNPLLHFATQIREQRSTDVFDYDYKCIVKDGMGVIPIQRTATDLIYDICDVFFANKIFQEYPDFMKVIAWRNVTVNAINKKVRELIYKDNMSAGSPIEQHMFVLPMLMPGEKMIADNPIKNEQGITILTTNAEFVVKGYKIKTIGYTGTIAEEVIQRTEFKYYETDIETVNASGVKKKHMIRILHEDCVNEYDTILKLFKIKINQISDGGGRAGGWRKYYELYNLFAKVKYNYAITAHKAQGSSYENCMMIEWDMYNNTKYEERNRIRYVAATRARKYLFIIK